MEQQRRSRSEKYAKEKKNHSESNGKTKRKGKVGRFSLLILTLVILAFVIGSIIGYSIIGEQNFTEAFQLKTWTHMFELIFG